VNKERYCLDRLDLAILKSVLVNNGVPPGVPAPRKSFRSMAKDLGVDQATVRARMRRFTEQGFLTGWALGLSPGVKGQDVGNVWVSVQRNTDKREVVSALLSAGEVERVCDYFGPALSLVYLFNEGTDPKPTVDRILRLAGRGVTLQSQGVTHVMRRPLTETDASIVRSVGENPWKSYSEVAQQVGVSRKTVARRMSRMTEEGTVYMLPIVDLKALKGVIPAELVVEYYGSREEVNAKVAARIGQNLVFSNVRGPFGYFAMQVENLSQLEQLAGWCKKLVGVKGVRVSALQDVILSPKHYHAGARRDSK